MHTRSSYFSLLLAALLSAGCASQVTAPVRDGAGGISTGTATPAPASGYHTVRQGDTLLGVARQYGVTLPDLVAWNNVTDPNQIHVGQTIRVSPPGAAPGTIAVPGSAGAVATPVPPIGTEAGSVPLVREPIGGRAPVAEPIVPEQPAPVVGEPAPAAAGSGQWQWPAGGALIAGYNEASNKGLDIGGSVGDAVYAASAGKVVYAGSGLRGYGKLIVIKHNQEYNSVYAHNDKLLVKEDDQVVQGQKIAELGSSEADRPKLHFEIRKQGKAVDPMGYLPAR
ncbi:peptidoglycan DD-metalloendopeptidase family protein [Thauera sp.]|jgi:lipoprotein NlpD|uniref:peptidoglycan DD-metalloendopeptidase family protein n=1 Tax=Thauera sp. TaxID=1905334 RepID=UPI002A36996D|nr:peptidoglycan DD-metalloendopeptidase family protein [Thauera sp.]MDX9884940.1 peptidoglycan DD-metalloendopeptidase family protein [Thauera sp.]